MLTWLPSMASAAERSGDSSELHPVPSLLWALPFAMMLLSIAILPLTPKVAHWWERNRNKLLVSTLLALLTCLYYSSRGYGFHLAKPGLPTLARMLNHAIVVDYIPFIVLLFSLFTISGGIRLSGDIPAHPRTNVIFILIGALLASFIGTTGASMLLIRPLLQVNSERKYVKHTVIFFIFLVSNIGGSLLPVGDPPLFLGYLRGVPFLWTMKLALPWLTCMILVLGLYWLVDSYMYRKEDIQDIRLDERIRVPLELSGRINFVFLLGVVLAVALLVPGKPLIGTRWILPDFFLREWVQLALAGLSMLVTSPRIRKANRFDFFAIQEVAYLFIGIFITMQVPLEILAVRGSELGLDSPLKFFWITGVLSAFLDNAPTYVVFFQTAGSLPIPEGEAFLSGLTTPTGSISEPLLVAISCGAVFLGAMSYIGNGPNFMVKSIAEQTGVRMPSFFGYMLYSMVILIPIFAIISLMFFRG